MIAFANAISVWNEVLSYEALWGLNKGSLKAVAETFDRYKELPSVVWEELRNSSTLRSEFDDLLRKVEAHLDRLHGFSACVHGAFEYPSRLREMRYPPEIFYYRGELALTESRCISIVGARSASEEGKRRAAKLAKGFVKEGFTIVSGLAEGIDTAAMKATIEAGGRTIGVVGTTITEYYPKQNRALQDLVGRDYLLMSQVPFYWYSREPFNAKKRYFPERNEAMSALSEATVIVEASERSGTLTQARACLSQGRQLFILNSCFENRDITWPAYYEEQGAIRVRDFDDIFSQLKKPEEVPEDREDG
jgi:DNA processing protein